MPSSPAPRIFDTLVAGLGAAGSSALYQLAKRGVNVLGIDRFSPPHAQGSSHGETRITRLAIGEGPHYTPFAMRSHEIWREIEQATGQELMVTTGGLILSGQTRTAEMHVDHFFENTFEAARKYGIEHQRLDAGAIRKSFPAFNVCDSEVGYFEPSAGYLRPEACIGAQLSLAKTLGAGIALDETILGFEPEPGGIVVHTSRGSHRARNVVLTLGPWLPAFLPPALARHFSVTRQVLFWFEPRVPAACFQPPQFPVFIWEPEGANEAFYGFPALGGASQGVKIATGEYGAATTPENVDRGVTAEEIDAMYRQVQARLPGLGPNCIRQATCLYTRTADAGFVIDRSPLSDNILIVSPCSGHGFKHSPAVGEAIAELIVDGRSHLDLSKFALARLESRP